MSQNVLVTSVESGSNHSQSLCVPCTCNRQEDRRHDEQPPMVLEPHIGPKLLDERRRYRQRPGGRTPGNKQSQDERCPGDGHWIRTLLSARGKRDEGDDREQGNDPRSDHAVIVVRADSTRTNIRQ